MACAKANVQTQAARIAIRIVLVFSTLSDSSKQPRAGKAQIGPNADAGGPCDPQQHRFVRTICACRRHEAANCW
jgi:hypothetical protein